MAAEEQDSIMHPDLLCARNCCRQLWLLRKLLLGKRLDVLP